MPQLKSRKENYGLAIEVYKLIENLNKMNKEYFEKRPRFEEWPAPKYVFVSYLGENSCAASN